MYIENLYAAFRKNLPANLLEVVIPEALEGDEIEGAYPPEVYTAEVVAEIVAALEFAVAGGPFLKGFCAESSGGLSEAEYDALVAESENASNRPDNCYYVDRGDGFSYVRYWFAPGFFQAELGGCSVQSGIDIYAWR